jgi:hypothetical protein
MLLKFDFSVVPLPQLLVTCLCFSVGAAAQAAPKASHSLKDAPPPGYYEIDSRSTSRSRSGPMELVTVTETDGRTGNQTRTTSGVPESAPVVQHVPGQGPVRQCVVYAAPPANAAAAACATQMTSERSYSNACGAMNSEERWRRVSDSVWEVQTEVSPGEGASPNGLSALPGMPAPPAAQMKGAMEAAGVNASAAMAPMLAQANKMLKSKDPQEVAMAQALVAQFKNGDFAANRIVSTSMGGQRWTVLQRYRRIADTCPKGSP